MGGKETGAGRYTDFKMRLGSRHAATALLFCLANHRQLGDASSRSVDSAYDTNKGVFSPQGRLVQLDYVEGLVKRGNLCMAAECKDGVVLVTKKLTTPDAEKLMDGGGIRRIYRVDSHIGILPAGLPADGRALAQKAMEYCRFHRREYGEPMPGQVLADRLGEHIHSACVRWGSRAYPNELLVACWDGGLAEADPALPCATSTNSTPATTTCSNTAVRQPAAATPDEVAATGDGRNLGDQHSHGSSRKVENDGGRGRDELPFVDEIHDQEHATDAARAKVEPKMETEAVEARVADFQLYVVDPGGAARRYRAACSGRGSARAREWLRNRSLSLSRDVAKSGDAGGQGERLTRMKEVDRRDPPEGDGGDDPRAGVGTKDSRGGVYLGRRLPPLEAKQQRRERERPLLLSEMTCAEAARAMVEEARRTGDEAGGGRGPQGGGRTGATTESARDVAGSAEVAWISMESPRKGRKEGKPRFVHYRSVDKLFEEEVKAEVEEGGGGGINMNAGNSDRDRREG